MAGLVRAGDVPGLVLDPYSPGSRESESPRQAFIASEGSGDESVAIAFGDLGVEVRHHLDELRIGHPAGDGAMVAVEESAVADERAGVVASTVLLASGKRTRSTSRTLTST